MLQIYHSAIETEVLPDIQYPELMNHLLSTLSLIPYNVDIITHIYSLKSEFEKFKSDVIKELPKAKFKDENVMVIRGSISEFETPRDNGGIQFEETFIIDKIVFKRFPEIGDVNGTYMFLYIGEELV